MTFPFPTFMPSGETDPYAANRVVLLHMDGSDAATTFTDVDGKTWTAVGNAQIDTAQSKFGGASGLFDGTGDYITTPDHADFNMGTGAFTIEFWVRLNGTSRTYEILGQGDSTDGVHFFLEFDGSARGAFFQIRASSSPVVECIQGATTGWSTGTWYHVAVVRNGNDFAIYRDGTSIATVTDTSGWADYSTTFKVGSFVGGSNDFDGWLDDLAIYKGAAVYTTSFTPRTSAIPDN